MEWIKYSLVYTADSIRKFDSKSNRTADSIRDSIRTQKTIRRFLSEAMLSGPTTERQHTKCIISSVAKQWSLT